jgi:membrane-bound serine protease (ClpP class)
MQSRIGYRNRLAGRTRGAAISRAVLAVGCLGAVALLAATAAAQPPDDEKKRAAGNAERPAAAAKEKIAAGVLVRLSLPINDNGSSRFIRTVRRALPKLPPADPRPVLIIEFSVGQSKDGLGSDFHSASRLAEFLISDELQHVKTVAYIPETIRGHGVLAALACREIVMAPTAEIGDAGVDELGKIPIRKETYDRIARATLTVQPAVALKMLDKDLDVRKVVFAGGAGGAEYVLADKVEEIKKERNVTEVISLKDGNLFSGQEARTEPRFVSHLATSRSELAKQLTVDARVLRESPLASDVKPIQVTISGEMTSKLAAEVMRQIDDNVKEGSANFVVVRIDSPGGNSTESQQLANYLADLDPDRVRTVAYIAEEAAGDAAIIALACDEIMMQPTAVLGGDGALDLDLNDGRGKQEVEIAVSTFREGVAKPKSRSWSIGAAIIDPSLKVYRYTNKSSGLVEYWSEEEAAEEQKDPQAWVQGPLITMGAGRLALTGEEAEEYGVITKTVESFEELKTHYDVDDPALVDPTWVDKLLRFLASPNVALFLLLIGGAAVYAELQTPGVGLGGMIAFICFLLFFWAKVFDGTAGALEILLFAAGLACVVIEVFVLPGIGMGIFALGGGLMIIVSLVLASQTFILPHTSYELRQMTNSLLVVGGAAAGTVAAIAGLRRWLPHAPVFNRMLLAPPSAEEAEHIDQRESLVNYEHLLGRSGTAVTRLAPSGKAQIGEELVDVITGGEFVHRDSQVVVVEVRGNCVVVASAQV